MIVDQYLEIKTVKTDQVGKLIQKFNNQRHKN